MKPYLKNKKSLVLDSSSTIQIRFDISSSLFFVVNLEDMSTFEFNHFENAIFCALSLFYDDLTVSMDELPFIDIIEDFDKLANIICEVSEDKK
jgi:hypothetical protein